MDNMHLENVKCVTTKLPTYLQILLQEDSTIKLVYHENKRAEIWVEPIKNEIVDLPNESTQVELIGNPLKVDLGADDSVCCDSVVVKPHSWTPAEALHGPLSLLEARNFINNHLKSKNLNEAMFCICDGRDPQHTVGLGISTTPNSLCRYLVHVLPCHLENTEIEYMKNDHLKNVKSNAEITMSSVKHYNIFGYDLRNCSSLSNVEFNGNISLDVFSNDTSRISQNKSDFKMNFQVILGHGSSPLIKFWEQLCFIQTCIKQLENTTLLNDATIINADSDLDSDDITSTVSDLVNIVSSFKNIVHEKFDLENVRQLNILDKLWNLLQHCGTLSDLRDCFHFFFEELAEKQTNMHVLKEDKSAIGDIVNGILDGRIAVPTLSFSQSLELLIELGLEKLKNDYVALFSHIYGIVKDSVVKKWSDLTYENSQISSSRTSQRKSRISINPKTAITDLMSHKLKFSYLYSLHKTSDLMFLYKQNLPIIEESFDAICESLCKKFIVGFQNVVQLSDVKQPNLCHFSCNISSADASNFIKGGSPVATTVKMVSDVNFDQVVTVFHLSDYPIFPPSIFEDYVIETCETQNKILFVAKLVKYVHNC